MNAAAPACPLCGAAGARFLFSGTDADNPERTPIPVHECGACRLRFSAAEPDQAPADSDYAENYYGENTNERTLNKLLIGLFQKERQLLALAGRAPGKVLDVGCGDGTFLRHLPAGWQRYAFEPSRAGRKELERFGLEFLDLHDPATRAAHQGTFDVITLWQSFEHIGGAEQATTLQAARELLKDGGRLFISVPNAASWQARLFRGRWFHLDPRRHLYHFTPPRLERLLREHGWSVEWRSTASLEYGVYGFWQSLLNCTPADFNMAYKILKGRKRYAKSARHTRDLLIHALAALPLLLLAGAGTALETVFGGGGVIHLRATKGSR